jgi:hypothetical protein
MISVDQEHGTGMDHILSAPVTHPMTQVGHIVMIVIIKKKMNTAIIVIVYVNNDIK